MTFYTATQLVIYIQNMLWLRLSETPVKSFLTAIHLFSKSLTRYKMGQCHQDNGAEVEVYPPELTLHDLVGRIGEVSSGALGGAATSAALADVATQLSPEVAAVGRWTLAQGVGFQDEHVQAIAILPIVFR